MHLVSENTKANILHETHWSSFNLNICRERISVHLTINRRELILQIIVTRKEKKMQVVIIQSFE